MTDVPLRIRAACDRDTNFVVNSWLRSFRESPFGRLLTSSVFFFQHHALLEELLPRVHVLVACNPEDYDHLYGYVAYETVSNFLVVHYAYVKQPYWRLGIGSSLLKAAGYKAGDALAVSHWTHVCKELKDRIPLVHNPYLAFPAKKGAFIGANAIKDVDKEYPV